jgi:hypothetical protein
MHWEQSAMRFKPPVTWFFAALPFVAFLVFVSMALHVRLSMGRWPNDALEIRDMSTGLALHYLFFAVMFLFGGVVAAPLWFVLLCFRALRISALTHLIQTGILFLGLLMLWGGMISLPPQWVTWFLD